MKITPEFGLILTKRNENEVNKNVGNVRLLKENNSDTFTSTTKPTRSLVSFKGVTQSPNKLVEMVKSSNYFKILGATIVATASALWTQLKEACGLPGYLILFDTHTFEPQRQLRLSVLPSQSEFFVISKHFTATPRIPYTSTALKETSLNCNFKVGPQTFTADLISRLRSL